MESIKSQHKRQEKTSPVFVYATANNVSVLPPELLRKGRFDDTFSVMLPGDEERREIFQIHLAKRGRIGKISDSELMMLVQNTKGWSGAEIESCITESMFTAFSNNRDIRFIDLQTAIDETVPLSIMMKAQIEAMETWCEGRTRPANASQKKAVHTKTGTRAVEA